MKKYLPIAAVCALVPMIMGNNGGCSDADVASRNLSRAADMFEVKRRVVFYNGITGAYILTVEGLCSLGNGDKAKELTVTCKTGPQSYKKHFLGLSDNVTFFAEQVDGHNVSTYHYRVIFKPQTILPDFEFHGDARELERALTPSGPPLQKQ